MKKVKVLHSLSEEVIDIIEDLARWYGVPKSSIVEKAIIYIVETGQEGELFRIKRDGRKSEVKGGNKEEKTGASEEKKEVKDTGFKLSL